MFNLITISISICALFFSYYNYDLLRDQDKDNKLLILKGTTHNDKLDLKFTATDPAKVFLMGTTFFLKDIHKDIIKILPDGTMRGAAQIEKDLITFIENKYFPVEGFMRDIEVNLPILVQSYYAAKGNTYIDSSVYLINLSILIPDKKSNEKLSIKFNGLVFLKRVNEKSTFTQDYLNTLMSEKDKIFEPSGTI